MSQNLAYRERSLPNKQKLLQWIDIWECQDKFCQIIWERRL